MRFPWRPTVRPIHADQAEAGQHGAHGADPRQCASRYLGLGPRQAEQLRSAHLLQSIYAAGEFHPLHAKL